MLSLPENRPIKPNDDGLWAVGIGNVAEVMSWHLNAD